MLPMLSFVRIGDIAANVQIIMDEHAAHAQGHVMVNTSHNCAPALFTWRVSSVPPSLSVIQERDVRFLPWLMQNGVYPNSRPLV